jgi:type III pantothenate kinase
MTDFFVIAIGNSSAAMALAADGAALGGALRVPVDQLDGLSSLLAQARHGRTGQPLPLIVASVNPAALDPLKQLACEVTHPSPLYVAGTDFPIPLRTDVENPSRVGVDRLLAALAAYRLAGGPCIVVDCGTAITVNAVRADGLFLGGAIFPGLGMMARALSEQTALLPLTAVPDEAPMIGRCTEDAIAAGILHGAAGAVANLILGAAEIVGDDARIFLTGGDAPRVARRLPPDCREISPDLVLEGLMIAYREWVSKKGLGPMVLGPRCGS